MSILAKYNKAMEDKDEAALRDIIHDDYTFTMHKSGTVLKKDDVVKWAMSGDINRDKVRVIYENDEIGVEHAFVTFNDGNKEAVMAITASLFPSLNVTNACSTPISSFS